MSANDYQISGTHYKKGPLEHWDLAAMFGWDYFQARSIAYIMRWRDKAGIPDLKKAGHFIQKYIEVEEARAAGTLTRDILKAALELLDEDEEQINVNGDGPLGAHSGKFVQGQGLSSDEAAMLKLAKQNRDPAILKG
jgi:hypothetical protein